MNFYLVRHAQALSELADPKRPLSDEGRKEAQKVARSASVKGVRVVTILHSDKLRAKQTAEIFEQFLSPLRGIREIRGLAPEDDPLLAKAELEATQEPLMLVGHLPHLGRLASMLVTGDPERALVEFPSATLVCLEFSRESWQIKWSMTPQTA